MVRAIPNLYMEEKCYKIRNLKKTSARFKTIFFQFVIIRGAVVLKVIHFCLILLLFVIDLPK